MIHINYRGGFGNNIFQYAIALIMSYESGEKIFSCDMPSANLHKQTSYRGYYRNNGIELFQCSAKHGTKKFDTTLKVGDRFDRSFKSLRGVNFSVDGMFQDYNLYKDYIDKLRWWTRFDKFKGVEKNSLVIHLRLGDFLEVKNWLDESKKGEEGDRYSISLNYSFYEDFLKDKNYDKIYVLTDGNENSELVQKLIYNHNAEYINKGNLVEDFRFLASSKNFLMSQSTFSWWAAILSDAKCYFPMTHNECVNSSHWTEKGHWRKNRVNLYPSDIDRFEKIYVYDKHYKID